MNSADVITREIGVPINFEGRYKWIAFCPPDCIHDVSVLNRYFGVMENGKIKVRGLEVRRRDTPNYIFDAQTEMINILAKADNTPRALQANSRSPKSAPHLPSTPTNRRDTPV